MDIDTLKRRLQDHLSDGLVTIIGSGLSVAEGIPSMGKLAEHVLAEIPPRIPDGSKSLWEAIANDLQANVDLETALLKNRPDDHIESSLVEVTAAFILEAETNVLNEVTAGTRVLRFTKLIPHMLKPVTGIPIITSNYDRLLEVAIEKAGLFVNTLFVGHHFGRLDAEAAHMSLCKRVTTYRGKHTLTLYPHAIVLKPHGSLDWYMHNTDPIRCPLPLSLQRLIITPGLNKYRGGYNRPFDSHRERANREIDRATRFLIIGYGFRDEHLQTHLEPALKKGKAALLLTHSLSGEAARLINECNAMIALCADPIDHGTTVVMKDSTVSLPGLRLWDVDGFVKGVFEL
jgi:hypothetical protein